MRTKIICSSEAKTNLPKLLDAVERGVNIIITRRKVPIAILTRYNKASMSVDQAINGLLEFRNGRTLNGLSINDSKNNRRKY